MTDFNAVGNQFVTHYYTTLGTDKSQLGALYTEESMLTYEGEQFMGLEQIGGKINQLPNLTFDSAGAVIDLQPSVNDGIVALVAGQLFIDGNQEQPLRFTQVFFLQKGGSAGYYIKNEMFRLALG